MNAVLLYMYLLNRILSNQCFHLLNRVWWVEDIQGYIDGLISTNVCNLYYLANLWQAEVTPHLTENLTTKEMMCEVLFLLSFFRLHLCEWFSKLAFFLSRVMSLLKYPVVFLPSASCRSHIYFHYKYTWHPEPALELLQFTIANSELSSWSYIVRAISFFSLRCK